MMGFLLDFPSDFYAIRTNEVETLYIGHSFLPIYDGMGAIVVVEQSSDECRSTFFLL